MFMPSVNPMSPVPHTMFVPQTMLSPSSAAVPQTMLSPSSAPVPHTMLSLSRIVPQTMFSAQAGSLVNTVVPQTMLVPQTMFWAHASAWPSMVVKVLTPLVSHQLPTGAEVSTAFARPIDPPTLSAPAPCRSVSEVTPKSSSRRSAEYCSSALTACGVSDGCAG